MSLHCENGGQGTYMANSLIHPTRTRRASPIQHIIVRNAFIAEDVEFRTMDRAGRQIPMRFRENGRREKGIRLRLPALCETKQVRDEQTSFAETASYQGLHPTTTAKTTASSPVASTAPLRTLDTKHTDTPPLRLRRAASSAHPPPGRSGAVISGEG